MAFHYYGADLTAKTNHLSKGIAKQAGGRWTGGWNSGVE
jgi:hypothetical protein